MIVTASRSAIDLEQFGWGCVREDLAAIWNRLYRFVLSKVRDPHTSEDITQETMTRLIAYRNEKPIGHLPGLGFAIARNLVSDHFRLTRPTEPLDDSLPEAWVPADEQMIQRQRLVSVQAVIDQMPPLRREIFMRRRIDGDSPTEIAESLHMSLSAVEKHLVRGLADLHKATRKSERQS